MPRFDQSFSGLCEQNLQDTLQLKQRFLDTKNKRPPKTKEKKQQDSIQSSVHVQQKFLKRSSEDHDTGGGDRGGGGVGGVPNENFEPPVKLQCTTQHGTTRQPEGLTKFSVEIVQQLEFTTSAANSQPQQISTNVTVKAHTNASVKSDVASPKSNPSTPASTNKSNIGLDVGTLVECVKQEPDNEFADLDQCAAALEKDRGTGAFEGFRDFMGDDTNDEIITSDAFKDLISDISNYTSLDFDFEDKPDNGLKVEELPQIDGIKTTHSPLMQNQNFSPPVFDNSQGMNKNRMPYPNMDFTKTELSPAAQTLKQMAEQHQHKNQMGLSFNPNSRAPNSRSPYPDFQFQGSDYGSPNSNSNYHKNSPNFPQTDMIKQEMIFQGNEYDMKRKNPPPGIYKQQYSPYGSPSASSHGSPGYLPRGNNNSNTGPTSGGAFTGGTPPRPPSGPGGNNNGTTLQINQAQQLHINQQNHGHIQVSAGQHLHLSGDLKGNVSIATQQGLHFNQHSTTTSNTQNQTSQSNSQHNQQQQQQHNQHNSQSQTNINQQHSNQQHSNQQHPNQQHPNQQHSNQQHPNQQHPNQQHSSQQHPSQQHSSQQHPSQQHPSQQHPSQQHPNQQHPSQQHPSQQHPSQQHPNQQHSNQQHANQQQQQAQPQQTQQQQHNSVPSNTANNPSVNQQQNISSHQLSNQHMQQGNIGLTSNSTLSGGNSMNQSPNMMNPSSMVNSNNHPGNHHAGMTNPHHQSQMQLNDNYSITQTQTINFTQQSLRQRTTPTNEFNMKGIPNAMGAPMGSSNVGIASPAVPMTNVSMGPRQMGPQIMDPQQQKLMQQQQMLRAQQQAAMQQHIVRPPPPDYKTSAGMMQGMQPRFNSNTATTGNIRRMPHQPMPPSGPMMRPHNMYMMQQQHMATRGVYPRQQSAMGLDTMPQHGSAEWRHLVMSQQQNANFSPQMRPNFQHQNFNINSGTMQMSALQHQQMRTQQTMVSGGVGQQNINQGMPQSQVMGQGQMAQMNSINQQIIHLQQQQQQSVMQQNNSQMSINSMHMQQSQSLSMNSQNLSQQSLTNQQQQQLMNNQNNNTSALNNFNQQSNDFTLEFFDNLPNADTSAFTEQELLNSFDADSGFNLGDIL